LYFILFISLVSAATNSTVTKCPVAKKAVKKNVVNFSIKNKSINELMKEIADTEAKRLQLKAQTNLAQTALERETAQMAKEHKVRMKKIAQQTRKVIAKNRLRQNVRDARIAQIRALHSWMTTKNQAKALKNLTKESLAGIEYRRKINIRNRIDEERRRQQLHKLKQELHAKQRKLELKYRKQHEKEERAFRKVRQSLWNKLDNDRKYRKDALLHKEMNIRKLHALEFERYKAQIEMERRMKRLTIAETQRQLFNLRRAEQIKREIVREGLKYKKLIEEQKMKKAEAKAKLIEDLKDQALKLMLEKENLMRVRKAEEKELATEVANVKKEIAHNRKIAKRQICSMIRRSKAIRKAKLIAERNRMRFLKIRSFRLDLAKKIASEESLFKRKLEELKKIKQLDAKARKTVKKLSELASTFDKKSVCALKQIRAEKKAIIVRKMLVEKAEEINTKRMMINDFKLKLHKLEEAELKKQMDLSGVTRDILKQKTLARILKMKIVRENRRRRRIANLKKKLDRMYLERRSMLMKKRCIHFRKTVELKKREEERRKKIACLLRGKRQQQNNKKCFDMFHGKYHRLIHKPKPLGCPFAKIYGVKSCDNIELP